MFRILNKIKQILSPEEYRFPNIRDDILKRFIEISILLVYPLALRWVTFACFINLHFSGAIFFYLLYKGQITMDHVFAIGLGVWVYVCYVYALFGLELARSTIEAVNNLNNLQDRGDLLFERMKRKTPIAIIVHVLSILYICVTVSYMPLFGNEEKIYYTVYFFRHYLPTWLCWACECVFYLCLVNYSFNFVTQGLFGIYFMFEIILQMYLLNDLLSEVADDNLGYSELFCLLENDHYQKAIDDHLKACIKFHINIRKFREKVQAFFYLPIIIHNCLGTVSCGVALSSMFIETYWCLKLRLLPTFITTISLLYLMGSLSQKIGNQAEKFYYLLAGSPWYLWNKSNRNTLRLMLVHSKEPLTIGSHIVRFDAALFLLNLRSIYTIAMFLLAVKRHS